MMQRVIRLGFLLVVAAFGRPLTVIAEDCGEFYQWVEDHCTNWVSYGCSCNPDTGHCEGWYEGENGTSQEVYCS